MIKNKIFQFLSFIFLVIFIFLFLNFSIRSEVKEFRWHQFKQIEENSIDILYMGNSHNMQGIIPQVIEDTINLTGFTIGVPNENLETTYYQLVEAFRTQSPQFVAIETFTIDVNLTETKGFNYHFYGVIPLSLNVIRGILQQDDFSIYTPFEYIDLARVHQKLWQTPSYYFYTFNNYVLEKNSYEISKYINSDGFLARNYPIDNETIEKIKPIDKSYDNLQLDQDTIYYLQKILDLCATHNAKVFLFTMPELRDSLSMSKPILDYTMISTTYKIPYYDLRDNDFTFIHYSDTNHVSFLGAMRSSLLLMNKFSDDFLFSINENQLHYYEELNIDGYDVEKLDDSFFRVVLFNEGYDLSNNQYQFEVKSPNGDTVMYGDKMAPNAFRILYDGPGEYLVNLVIQNNNLPLKIEQDFFVTLP